MATLNVFTADTDLEIPITTIDDLQSAIPAAPYIPSAYCLDIRFDNATGSSVQVWFGDPDRHHTTVVHITGDGVEKEQFDSIEDALTAFYHVAEAAL